MIKNEREYRITKASLTKFKRSLAQIASLKKESKYDSVKLKLQADAITSIVKDLQKQIKEFENLKKEGFPLSALSEIESIPKNLIKARIALGWTQKALAQRLGTTEQQIQKYESSDYESASLKRIVEISAILKDEHKRV